MERNVRRFFSVLMLCIRYFLSNDDLLPPPFSSGIGCQCINVILAQPRVNNDNLAGKQLRIDNF